MCSSCSSNNDQLLTTPTRFPASPRADDFIHDHSSTAHLLSILPNSTVLPPQHSQQCVTRALWDIYLTLDIHKQKTSLVIYALQDLIISREEIGRQLVFTKFADIWHIFI